MRTKEEIRGEIERTENELEVQRGNICVLEVALERLLEEELERRKNE